MYELNVNSRKQLERATLRAQAQKPKIEEIAFGMYKVWSTNPETPWMAYSTGIEAAPDGQGGYAVCCPCPTTRFLCKHVAACFPHYLLKEKQYAEQGSAPDFMTQAQEIKDICAATTATLAGYTAGQAAKDRQDLFG